MNGESDLFTALPEQLCRYHPVKLCLNVLSFRLPVKMHKVVNAYALRQYAHRADIRGRLPGLQLRLQTGQIGKSARQASLEIYKYLSFGLTNIVDIGIEDFFGTIDHDKLVSFVYTWVWKERHQPK